MKKLFIIAILSCNFLNAQNVFPTTGNVGIGTTAPKARLKVAGNTLISPLGGNGTRMVVADESGLLTTQAVPSVADNLGNHTATQTLNMNNNNIVNAFSVQTSGNGYRFFNSTGGPDAKWADIYSWVSNGSSGGVSFRVLNDAFNQSTEYMRANRSGLSVTSVTFPNSSIGIGTNTPSYKLTITSDLPPYSIGMRPSGGLGLLTNNVANLSGQLGWVRRADQTPVLVLQGVEEGVAWRDVAIVKDGGNVGIGTVNPGYKLDVIGTVRAREIRVNLGGADFVFEDGYKLMPLNELEKFVKQNKHLPEIAPAKEMQEKGSDLGSLAVQLLQKIEELTLHAIEQNKEVKELRLHVIEQNKEIEKLKVQKNNK